ncbi:MAG: hypothetical protein QOH63_2169 [Acidobacteriota bacterium]|jgi:hypothetical protein|nr:hypothetical protein [Acidobacteriota bacterium]
MYRDKYNHFYKSVKSLIPRGLTDLAGTYLLAATANYKPNVNTFVGRLSNFLRIKLRLLALRLLEVQENEKDQ